MKLATRNDAKKIGTNDATAFALAAAMHKAWSKADAEGQAAIALDFKIGYMAGREKISLAQAEAIIAAGKGDGVSDKHRGMIDRAYSAYRYYIVQGKNKDEGASSARRMPVSRAHKAAALAFLAEFDGDSLEEQIKIAIAVLRAL